LCDLNKEKLPYPDNQFDIIIFTEVIEHIYNPGFVLKEINRILKPKGKLYLSTPNLINIKNKMEFLLFSHFLTHPNNPEKGGHITHMPPNFIKNFLEINNFSNITKRFVGSFIPMTKIKLLNNSFLSDIVIFEATKN